MASEYMGSFWVGPCEPPWWRPNGTAARCTVASRRTRSAFLYVNRRGAGMVREVGITLGAMSISIPDWFFRQGGSRQAFQTDSRQSRHQVFAREDAKLGAAAVEQDRSGG